MAVQYKIPDYVHISQECRHLLSRIFVASPARVCTVYVVNSTSELLFYLIIYSKGNYVVIFLSVKFH